MLVLTSIIISDLCAQTAVDMFDILVSQDDKLLINKLQAKNLAPNSTDFSKSHLIGKFHKTIISQQWNDFLNKSVNFKGLDIRASHFYVSRDTMFSANSLQLPHYSTFGVSASTSILNKPVQVGGDLILTNGKVNTNLSTLSVGFDPRLFLDNLKSEYAPVNDPSDFFGDETNPLNLNEEEKQVFKDEFLFTVFQQIIADPKFRSYATGKLMLWDSLQNELNSIVRSETVEGQFEFGSTQADTLKIEYAKNLSKQLYFDSQKEKVFADQISTLQDSSFYQVEKLYEQISDISEDVKEIEIFYERYDSLWKNKKEVNLETVKSLGDKINSYSNQVQNLSQPDELKQFIGKQKELKVIDKFLLYTESLDIGFFPINRSDNVVNYLSLNGIHFAYDKSKYFGEVAYGNQSLSTQFLPSFGSLLSNRYFGKNVFYANAGVRTPSENFETSISILKVRESNSAADSLIIIPKSNTVLGWSGQTDLTNSISLKSIVAISDLESGISNGEDNEFSSDDVSFAVSSFFEPEKSGKFYIEAGYFYNGKDYVTLGNPFLLTNRQGVNLAARYKLLKNKLSLNGDIKFSKNIETDVVSPFKDIQYLGEVNYRFGKANSISGRFMPNVFTQELGASGELVANNNIYNIQANFQNSIKSNQLYTVVNLTNLRSDIQLIDTISIDERSYLYMQEIFMMLNGNSINMSLITGNDNLNFKSITDFLFQLDGTVQFNKCSFNIGSQIIKQEGTDDWQIGLVNRLRFNIFERGSLNFNSIYRRSISKEFGNNSVQANISVTYSLLNSQKQNLH